MEEVNKICKNAFCKAPHKDPDNDFCPKCQNNTHITWTNKTYEKEEGGDSIMVSYSIKNFK